MTENDTSYVSKDAVFSIAGVSVPESRRIWWSIFACIGFFVLLFFGIGNLPLLDPDEPFYGQVAKEMVQGNDWLTPHLNNEVFWDKPPLFYWLSSAAMKIFGVSELTARLPSAVMAIALAWILFVIGRYDYGPRVGIMAGLILASCIQHIVLSRAAVTDMTLAFCLMSALYGYRRWFETRTGERFYWAFILGLMLGLGVLTKGPVAFILIGGTIFIHLLYNGRLRDFFGLDVLFSLVIMCAVFMPWYYIMYSLHGQSFIDKFIIENNFGRFLSAEHPEVTGHWYSYLMNFPVLLLFFFPWSVFIPQALKYGWQKASPGSKIHVIWFSLVFLFFSTSKTQLVTYIFPLYPIAALLVARFWNAAMEEGETSANLRPGLIANIVLSIIILLALFLTAQKKYPDAQWPGFFQGALTLSFSAAGFLFFRGTSQFRLQHSFLSVFLGMCIFTVFLMALLLPSAAPFVSTRELLQGIPRDVKARFVAVKVKNRLSLLFYFERNPEEIAEVAQGKMLFNQKDPVLMVCKASQIENISPGKPPIRISGDLALLANFPIQP